MNCFVIQEHTTDEGVHYDLMLERFFSLHTWSLDSLPPEHANCSIMARRIHNHRKKYLEYEGPISGGRGSVRIWDSGTYDILERDLVSFLIEFTGSRLSGVYRLQLFDKLDGLWIFQGPIDAAEENAVSENLETVTLVKPENVVEAQLFLDALLQQNITCSFQKDMIWAELYGLPNLSALGRIVVFEKDIERASEIIEKIRAEGGQED